MVNPPSIKAIPPDDNFVKRGQRTLCVQAINYTYPVGNYVTTNYDNHSSSYRIVDSLPSDISPGVCGPDEDNIPVNRDLPEEMTDGRIRSYDSDPFADTTPPVISSLTSSDISQTGAKITWTTNEAASSRVEYGLTSSYGSQTSETNTNPRVTSHAVTLIGLSANTTYNYRAKSKDAAGNEGVSSNKTFTTQAASSGGGSDTTAPTISNLSATTTQTSATIKWTTNEAATHTIKYGSNSGNLDQTKSAGSGTLAEGEL